MGQAQAVDTLRHQQMISNMANRPIHKSLAYIIPYLEQRAVAARKLEMMRTDESKEAVKEFIDHLNHEIKNLLDIPNEPFTKK